MRQLAGSENQVWRRFLENQITLESGCVKCGNFTLESGYEKAKELFTEHPDVDTLICATDTMAVGAANWLKENGYQIPQQVQIAGMGDSFLGKIIEPKLTTVHFFTRQVEWNQQKCW